MTEDPLFGTSIHEGPRQRLTRQGPLDDLSGLARWLGPVEDLALEGCFLE